MNLIGNRQAGNDDLMALATALSHARPRHGTQPQDIEPTPLLAQAQRLRRPDRVGGRRAACTRPPRAHAGWGSATAFVRDRPMTSSESIPPVPDALAAKLRDAVAIGAVTDLEAIAGELARGSAAHAALGRRPPLPPPYG